MALNDRPEIKVQMKPGVLWGSQSISAILALYFCAYAYEQHGEKTLTITSLQDGEHMKGSKHYTGQALDVRLPDTVHAEDVTNTLATMLGPDFDVILEPDHLHIEYDPKPPNRRT